MIRAYLGEMTVLIAGRIEKRHRVAASPIRSQRSATPLSNLPDFLNRLQAKGKHTELRFVLNNLLDDFRRDHFGSGREAIDQCGIAKNIDRARNPAAGIGDDPARVIGEQVTIVIPRLSDENRCTSMTSSAFNGLR